VKEQEKERPMGEIVDPKLQNITTSLNDTYDEASDDSLNVDMSLDNKKQKKKMKKIGNSELKESLGANEDEGDTVADSTREDRMEILH